MEIPSQCQRSFAAARRASYRVVLVGAGTMGKRHLNVVQASPRTRLSAIYDPRPTSDLGLAPHHAVRHVRTRDEYRRCLEDADIAVIAADTSNHLTVTLDAIAAGVSCLLEKPATGLASGCQQIAEASRACGVKVAVAHVERFNAALIEAEKHVRGRAWQKIQLTRLSPGSARLKHQSLVGDLMVHDIDIALHVFKQHVHGECRVAACCHDANGIAYLCVQYVSVEGSEVEICCGRLPGAQVRHIRVSGGGLDCHADLLRRSVDVQGPSPAQRQILASASVDALAAQLEEFIEFLATGARRQLS